MSHNIIRKVPVVGVVVAIILLAISTLQYAGDVHWTRVTVSLLCASELPNGDPNFGRGLPIAALLLLCSSMGLLFELISRLADSRGQRKAIQIAGIGAMVYAFLTATPMHNLMVNIALVFFLIAILAIVNLLYRKRHFGLTIAGAGCIVLKLCSVSLYYMNAYAEIWGVLQKLSFIVTTVWLVAVLQMVKPKANRGMKFGGTELADGEVAETASALASR